jgi:hypothetical protein
VKTSVECSQADNTEEISLEIRRTLTDKSVFYRRFAEAYPDMIYRTDRIMPVVHKTVFSKMISMGFRTGLVSE